MNKLLTGMILVSITLSMGCAGGGLIVGPVSYCTAVSNDRSRLHREVNASTLPQEKKAAIVKLSAVTTDTGALGAFLNLDVGQLLKGDYTWGEILKQLGGDLADAGIYTGVIYGLKRGVDHWAASDPVVPDPSAEVNDNVIIVVNRSSNVTIAARRP